MKRYLDSQILRDLPNKPVFLTGPRQVGKTTLGRQLMGHFEHAQYFNWDVLGDRVILQRQTWSTRAPLLVLDEIHKMRSWKQWLKGVIDARPTSQSMLITGSARMDTFRQAGESLAGRYFAFRMHPISVREWCAHTGAAAADALTHLMERGGFPEPCLAPNAAQAERWRNQYFTDLIREDVMEFSRLHEINTMRLFVELLRERVGAPLSLASIARDLATSPVTLKRYLEILEALFIVFSVRPWHRNIGRAILQTPKVYFYDNGLVKGDAGVRLENAIAGMLLKHADFVRDTTGRAVGLHYIRTKDGAEVDFALSGPEGLTHLIECKHADNQPSRALVRFANEQRARGEKTEAIQLVRELRHEEHYNGVAVVDAAEWLTTLAA